MPPNYSLGELGKYAAAAASQLVELGWAAFMQLYQSPSSLHPAISQAPHPAASYLHQLARSGVPAPLSSTPWSLMQRDHAYLRGLHPSAALQHTAFLIEDMYDYVKMGYWTVLPFESVRHMPHLKLAPAGVVPQCDRRPRPIMDYSFSAIDQHSLPLAPTHAMQFGHALQRFLQCLVYANPIFGPPLLAKVDLADGYYHIPLAPEAVLELAVLLPPDTTGQPLIGIPLSLPMGWAQSPPYFCAFTETGADIANLHLIHRHNLPPHPLESMAQLEPLPLTTDYASSALLPHQTQPPPQPLAYADVYIDDFLAAAQPPCALQVHRALFHAIDSIFYNHPASPRRQVISSSKLAKGDASWHHQQRILGWDVNTLDMTLQLPAHRLSRLQDMLSRLVSQCRTSRRKWHRLLGELRSMAPALHSTCYLFSILQHVLVDQQSTRLRLNNLVRQSL
jgi:hypothetical protein